MTMQNIIPGVDIQLITKPAAWKRAIVNNINDYTDDEVKIFGEAAVASVAQNTEDGLVVLIGIEEDSLNNPIDLDTALGISAAVARISNGYNKLYFEGDAPSFVSDSVIKTITLSLEEQIERCIEKKKAAAKEEKKRARAAKKPAKSKASAKKPEEDSTVATEPAVNKAADEEEVDEEIPFEMTAEEGEAMLAEMNGDAEAAAEEGGALINF